MKFKGSSPSVVNVVATDINSAIQVAIFNVAVNALKTAAVADFPWLALPVVSQLFSLLVNTVARYVYKYLSQVATFAVIDAQVASENNSYQQSVTQLQSALTTGDSDAISQAQAAFEANLASLIHFDGSA